jgi:hypothetical protein
MARAMEDGTIRDAAAGDTAAFEVLLSPLLTPAFKLATLLLQQPGRNGVATSPSPSPSASPSPPRAASASCAATYTVNGNVLTVTIVTDGAPILGSFSVTDQLGDQGFNQASNIQRGQTTLQRSVNVSPPVIRVEISLESINHSFDPILCVATPAG